MDDLVPEKLWEEKGADYIAPYNEVLQRVARWLEADLQVLWDLTTHFKHPWFLSRKAGLRAWADYEARLRLNPFYREKYTVADYCELNLVERMQTKKTELKDPYWRDFITFQTQTEGFPFWRRIVKKAELKRVQHQIVHRIFCCYWDRFFLPFEFWTYPAMEACLIEILKSKGARYDSVSEGNLRQLVANFNLEKSRHVIVREFVAGSFPRFDEKAAAAAGLPIDVISVK